MAGLFTCLASKPYYENDYYRYIWDGIVTSHLDNALIISPGEVHHSNENNSARHKRILERQTYLPQKQRAVLLKSINYPESPSIYGPVIQYYLGLNNILTEFFNDRNETQLKRRIFILRCSLLFLILCTSGIVLLIIRHLQNPPHLIYGFLASPLIFKEVGNSLHIDILPVLLTVTALLMHLRRHALAAGICMGLSICCKFYPVVLLPLFCIATSQKKKFLLSVLITIVLAYLPYMEGGLEIFSGLRYFSLTWTMNDFIPALFRELFFHLGVTTSRSLTIFPIGEVQVDHALDASRWTCMFIFAIATLTLVFARFKKLNEPEVLIRTMAQLLFILFLLSPVQNPWYLLWILPFAICAQRRGILFFIVFSQLYLFNFLVDSGLHIFHPFQWWLFLSVGATLLYCYGKQLFYTSSLQH